MLTLVTLLIAATAAGQDARPGRADAKLDHMKEVAASYRFVAGDDQATVLRQDAEPAFRMGRQAADDVLDGAIFFWAGPEGRPAAALQVFQVQDRSAEGGHWVQEFISLAPGTFEARRDGKPGWSPRVPGIVFRPVPGAPRPAEAPAEQARQRRDLAREFAVADHFKNHGWSELRLLPKPVVEYGKAGSGVSAGALYAFTLATDPEAFLFLEVRAGAAGPEWHYAFAPMGCFEMKGRHKDAVVWTVPYKKDAYDPTQPYFVRLD